jgi:K+-transporting ATPase ATPase C chain
MKTFLSALKIFLILTFITGIAYPLAVSGFARVFYPGKAGGDFIESGGKTVGSELIGQSFKAPRYFWGRPSAIGYNPLPSGGSNLSPVSLALQKQAVENSSAFLAANPGAAGRTVPAEMVFASASGLDPHITPEAALAQIERVAAARGFDSVRKKELVSLVASLTERRDLGFLGENRVNVLKLNLSLDQIK